MHARLQGFAAPLVVVNQSQNGLQFRLRHPTSAQTSAIRRGERLVGNLPMTEWSTRSSINTREA